MTHAGNRMAEHGIRVNAIAPGTVETPSRAAYFNANPEFRTACSSAYRRARRRRRRGGSLSCGRRLPISPGYRRRRFDRRETIHLRHGRTRNNSPMGTVRTALVPDRIGAPQAPTSGGHGPPYASGRILGMDERPELLS
jgi:NAD(P)-dependent dehydrogenase (short-subunit alcohol dehydrogenase family)